MKIEVILIATEILEGKITDLNCKWLALFLREHGLSIHQATTVRDELDLMVKAISTSLERADIVITSGGIGPTKDDLTKEVYQNIFNLPMEKSSQANLVAQENYQRFGRPFNSKFNHYDIIPKGVTPLPNPKGLAPGLLYQHHGKYLVSVPGVPHEFQAMMSEIVFPKLFSNYQSQKKREVFNVRTKLIPEEKIFGQLCPDLWDQLQQFGEVSSLPKLLGIDVGVLLEGQNAQELLKKKAQLTDIFNRSPLAPHIWHFGIKDIEELIVQELKTKHLTVSGAESCTGGLCSSRLTDVSGSSEVFIGSIVSYANEVKFNELSVSDIDLASCGAVSEPVAKQMAEGARLKFKTDLAFSLTGIAGPTGGSEDKPVGTVWIGISSKKDTRAQQFQFKGDRTQLKLRFSQMCFYLLLNEIQILT